MKTHTVCTLTTPRRRKIFLTGEKLHVPVRQYFGILYSLYKSKVRNFHVSVESMATVNLILKAK